MRYVTATSNESDRYISVHIRLAMLVHQLVLVLGDVHVGAYDNGNGIRGVFVCDYET